MLSPTQQRYFRLMAEVDHTKHIGGLSATEEIIALADIGPGDSVLDVGCGVGITPVLLIAQYDCRVTGIDAVPALLHRAAERARREGTAAGSAFATADALKLPFPDGHFDVAMAESVLSFLEDKAASVAELVRVVRPGGRVAFTEAIWVQEPPPEMAGTLSGAAGLPSGLLAHARWQEILAGSGLESVTAREHRISARGEAADQYKRLGWRQYLRILSRSVGVLFNPEYRSLIGDALGSPPGDYFNYMGYGVYAGRKPT